MIWSLKQITGVICTAVDRPQLRTSRFGPQMRSGRKTLLTLENCGEPDSHLRPGFSRSIGKTDNTRYPTREQVLFGKPSSGSLIWGIPEVRGSVQNKNSKAGSKGRKQEKPHGWLFCSMADHWPPKVPRQRTSAGSEAPVAAGPSRT